MSEPLLQMSDIEKSFFGTPVLQGISLQVRAGETLGLVGENGAGKSTLMNILGGNLRPDAGRMQFDGQTFTPGSSRDAENAGVAFIHQELNLFPNLSIAENLFLTRFPRRFWGIDRREMQRHADELLRQVGLTIPCGMRVENLSAGERQLVEIAKALNLDAQLIILDEPTTSLTERETSRLFDLLRAFQSRGIAMIYISHALGDVQQLCHAALVMRDGRVVAEGPIAEFDTQHMVSLMVGRQIDQLFPMRTATPSDEVALAVQGVSQPGVVDSISFTLRRGEVLGISGLMGSGRTELARILFGLDPQATGQILLGGQRIEHLSTRRRVQRGMALLTESRRDDGLCMPASIHENMAMVCAPRFTRSPFGWLKRKPLNAAVESTGRAVKLSATANLRQPVMTLSGGNQQKVVLAKWLLNQPQVLILDEPTRGIDVGAKYDVYTLIDELAASGAAVLMISSEIEELIGVCDRILVMGQGEIRDELSRDQFDRHRILQAALRSDAGAGGAA